VPIAIEVFDVPATPSAVRIDINGVPWATAARDELPGKLAEIGRAYATGELAQLLADSCT
jgi:hypothetical protein